VTTQRIPLPLSPQEAADQIENLSEAFALFDLTRQALLEGIRGSTQHQLSIWGSLIWAVARTNGVRYILSEDLQDRRVIEGVRCYNPFLPTFEMSLVME
jgi:predicted nucleic acid-binding protein